MGHKGIRKGWEISIGGGGRQSSSPWTDRGVRQDERERRSDRPEPRPEEERPRVLVPSVSPG